MCPTTFAPVFDIAKESFPNHFVVNSFKFLFYYLVALAQMKARENVYYIIQRNRKYLNLSLNTTSKSLDNSLKIT